MSALTLFVQQVFFVVSRAPSIAIFGHARGLAGLYGPARVPACQSAVLTAAQATVQVGAPEGRAVWREPVGVMANSEHLQPGRP
jgi:hypothetical protein